MTAAPETETDANGLTEAERETLAKVEFATWAGQGERYDIEWADHLLPAVERIVAERVRVVEDERDAAPTGAAAIGRVLDLEGQVNLARARAESAEAAHEAEKARVASVVASLTADEPCGEGCRAAEIAALLLGDGED